MTDSRHDTKFVVYFLLITKSCHDIVVTGSRDFAIMTTTGVTNDDNLGVMTYDRFQYCHCIR